MKAKIIGPLWKESINFDSDDFIIGVDAGVKLLMDQHISLHLAVGDFDSVDDQVKRAIEKASFLKIQLNPKKDESDLAIAILYAIEHQMKSICIYGCIGKRFDHSFANILLLKKWIDYDLTLINENNKIYFLKTGTHTIPKEDYQYISFFAFQDCLVKLKGFLYDIQCYPSYSTIGLSNEIVNQFGTINISGELLVIQSKD